MGDGDQTYVLNENDEEVIEATIWLLERALNAPFMTAAKMVSVAKMLHVLRGLPSRSEDMCVYIQLCGPSREVGDSTEHYYWDFQLENGCISISFNGYTYQPSVGGDSFTCWQWAAWPGHESEYKNHLGGLWMVDGPDAEPDLTESGYSLIIYDGENPLLPDAG